MSFVVPFMARQRATQVALKCNISKAENEMQAQSMRCRDFFRVNPPVLNKSVLGTSLVENRIFVSPLLGLLGSGNTQFVLDPDLIDWYIIVGVHKEKKSSLIERISKTDNQKGRN